MLGGVINPENRTFNIEIKLRTDFQVQPNQVVVVTLRDYNKKNTLSVPTRLILSDNTGQFIYVIESKNNKNVARRVYIKTGTSYGGNTEILDGLAGGETIIGDGFRDAGEGVEVQVSKPELAKDTTASN
jgi:multidrug efflux pump subunit AcrA (membrane-fusion protein)